MISFPYSLMVIEAAITNVPMCLCLPVESWGLSKPHQGCGECRCHGPSEAPTSSVRRTRFLTEPVYCWTYKNKYINNRDKEKWILKSHWGKDSLACLGTTLQNVDSQVVLVSFPKYMHLCLGPCPFLGSKRSWHILWAFIQERNYSLGILTRNRLV